MVYTIERYTLTHARERARKIREIRLIDRFIHDPIKVAGLPSDYIAALLAHRRELDASLMTD